MKVAITPKLYEWAIERSQLGKDKLQVKFPKLDDWITGNKQPTFKQLEKFAKAIYLPVATLFLQKPPEEELPIADFRTFDKKNIRSYQSPSPHLLDTIYDCQLKQDWYINYCRLNGEDKNTFVGSFSLETDASIVAKAIYDHFPLLSGQSYKSMSEAFSKRKEAIEEKGILVMTSGVVRGNARRPRGKRTV